MRQSLSHEIKKYRKLKVINYIDDAYIVVMFKKKSKVGICKKKHELWIIYRNYGRMHNWYAYVNNGKTQ